MSDSSLHADFMTTGKSTLMDHLSGIARAAGDAILTHYGNAFAEMKADRSPLTAADRAAHDLICDALRESSVIPIISEESEMPDAAERQSWTSFWMVDPLDGTKEFLKRSGEFTVNIALIENSYPVAGVVFAPATSILYGAKAGEGAWADRGDGPRPIHCLTSAPRRLRVATSRDHSGEAEEKLFEQLGDVERTPLGSSLKFCAVAEGSIDLYPRLGPTMEWDTAAAQCIVEQAGGHVVTADGSRLQYNKWDLRNPSVFSFADQSVFTRTFADSR